MGHLDPRKSYQYERHFGDVYASRKDVGLLLKLDSKRFMDTLLSS